MKKDNCTAILVGKDASIDGSTMIARDEDGYGGINEKLFVVNKEMAASGLLLQRQMIQKVAGMNKVSTNITWLCLLRKLKQLMRVA